MNESGEFFLFCFIAAFIADAEYFHWYVRILGWFWPALQCESMQPAQQMAWSHYLNLYSYKTLQTRLRNTLKKKSNVLLYL